MWLLDRTAAILAALCSVFDVTPDSVLMHKQAQLGPGPFRRLADHSGSSYLAVCRMMGTLIRRP